MGLLDLALRFGYADPDKLADEITLDNITEWSAYFAIKNADADDPKRREKIKDDLHGDAPINDSLMDQL